MFSCLYDRSLGRAERSGLQPKVIICIERLLMVKDTQSNLYYFIVSSVQRKKNTRKLLRKIGAPCKGKPLHGSLAFEWFSFSRDV